MIDNIGNPKVTRVHLAELQTFYEAQLEAYRHYTSLQASLKPLQDAADVLRASGVVNVDTLLSQPVSATKAMIDEMEAEADTLRANIDAAVAEHLTDEKKADGWVFVGYDGVDVCGDDWDLAEIMPSMVGDGTVCEDSVWSSTWDEVDVSVRVIAVKPPEGYELRDGLIRPIEDTLNDLTPHEGEEECEDIPPMPEGEAEPMFLSRPEGDGWRLNTGEYPFNDPYGRVRVDVKRRDGCILTGGSFYWGLDGVYDDIIWYRKAQPVEQEAEPERKFKAGDRVRDKLRSANGTVTGYTELDSVEFQIDGRDYTSLSDEDDLELIVDHAAEATAQIEAQAETDSTETMEAEPETAETMQAIDEPVEAVDVEPETPATSDEAEPEQTAEEIVQEIGRLVSEGVGDMPLTDVIEEVTERVSIDATEEVTAEQAIAAGRSVWEPNS